MIHRSLIIIPLVLVTVASIAASADPAAEANKKLRETLRNTMIQLRTVETDKATLQAAQTELELKNKEQDNKIKSLERKVADLIKQSAIDKAEAEKKATEQASSIVTRDVEIARQAESLKKWKEHEVEAVALMKKLSDERARKTSEAVMLQRRVDDQQRRNAEMYKIGTEVLSRLENFGLGTALTAREPFVGTTRVKLQNLFQDYADKLADAKIKPGQSSSESAPQPAPAHSETPAKDSKAQLKKSPPVASKS
ncbi:MAG: phage major capsid protein [Verrucomicrobia bacterium]|nr:phage major capsid protein [Verrucomicrobiota bacterium]